VLLLAAVLAAAGAAVVAHGSRGHEPVRLDRAQLASLRGATARFHRIEVALEEGYAPFGDCFSDPALGGMGYHYANDALIADPAIDPLRPELLVYESLPNGELRLVAVEYISFVSAWHGAGNAAPPSLFGQEFHVNPDLLDEPFYVLHAWAWKHNPSGILSDWNPTVSCP
jgi:hypothetical protein